MSTVKIYSSETNEFTYADDFDKAYTELHNAGKFVKGYWVAEESLAWVKENAVGHYFIVERNNTSSTDWINTINVLPVAAPKKKIVLFAEVKDATHFKMVWI